MGRFWWNSYKTVTRLRLTGTGFKLTDGRIPSFYLDNMFSLSFKILWEQQIKVWRNTATNLFERTAPNPLEHWTVVVDVYTLYVQLWYLQLISKNKRAFIKQAEIWRLFDMVVLRRGPVRFIVGPFGE